MLKKYQKIFTAIRLLNMEGVYREGGLRGFGEGGSVNMMFLKLYSIEYLLIGHPVLDSNTVL